MQVHDKEKCMNNPYLSQDQLQEFNNCEDFCHQGHEYRPLVDSCNQEYQNSYNYDQDPSEEYHIKNYHMAYIYNQDQKTLSVDEYYNGDPESEQN